MASEHRRAVGVFPDRPRTASALQALSDSGFAMKHVSVIAKDPERQNAIAGVDVKDEVTNRADEGGAVGAVTGGILGGVTGLLVGLGTLTIPGLGPALLAGEAAAVLSTLVGGAAGAAAGGIVGALIGLGIPEHRAKHYRDRIEQGDYLVMLKDSEPEIARAERTLKEAGIEDWGVYPANDEVTSPGAATGVAAGRANDYNRVDHPMDQGYPHREATPQMSPPHAANPINDTPDYAHAADSDERRVVGIFHDRQEMEAALNRLKEAGFPMHSLSIAVRESEATTDRGHQLDQSHSLAGATTLAAGLNYVDLPEVGSTLVMGPDASAFSNAVDHSTRSAVGVLENLGIAHEPANLYSRHLMNGDYLVTMRGRNEELMQAASTLGTSGMRDWGIYDIKHA